MRHLYLLLSTFMLCASLLGQEASLAGKITHKETGKGVAEVSVFLVEMGILEESDQKGFYFIKNTPAGEYTLQIFKEGFSTQTHIITIGNIPTTLDIQLMPLDIKMETIEISDQTKGSMDKMRDVEDFAIYGGKKTEVIRISAIQGNLAVNHAREIYKDIAGLNIHENDAAGLQLSIGARGLDPNRTANFNTRQNGYDISADALGYPESYYTPPVQALRKIEIVRGAASLQYGPQFGGLLNFVFKDGHPDKKIHLLSENTTGSNGLFTTFNSIGGSHKDWNYYAFHNYKRGDGFRPASGFEQHVAHAKIRQRRKGKWEWGAEYTYMEYLSQQPGGLQDFEFMENPYQSKRQRNWFDVDWHLAALHGTYYFSPQTRINTRFFHLNAQRQALGELSPINRPDPLRERDLIRGEYQNWGNETRFVHQYKLKDRPSTLLLGMRYYHGHTDNAQGDAPDGSGADFHFLTEDPNLSAYQFPSRNLAFFAEHLFNIHNKWSITPGLRWEYIRTASEGYFYSRLISGGEIIFEQRIPDSRENRRHILLAGLGVSYRINEDLEAYANFSQNYRPINFTDLAIQNPNLVVDSLLQDERGYNLDIGLRGKLMQNKIRLDATAFALRYNNRIGITDIVVQNNMGLAQVVDYRTNIGNALIIGLETYLHVDILQLFNDKEEWGLTWFSNLSLTHGRYLSGGSDVEGNEVELIPPFNWKTGLDARWKNLRATFQYSQTAEHYSDATNAIFVANATRGLIPSYQIMDTSLSYHWKWFTLSSGVNNLTDAAYFTRRTASYPGPGIIPAQGRNYYIGLRVEW